MIDIVSELKTLKEKYGVVGIKQSFEDEGALLEDVSIMRRITDKVGLYLSVKIGGCEAISDINTCKRLGVDNIVAPMIESEFALQKFVESISEIKDIEFYINIESKNAFHNLDHILKSPSSKLLSGIVVGRSDLTKSYGYSKDYVDSPEMLEVVKEILTSSKSYGFKTLMGGNVSTKSVGFVKEAYKEGILGYIETRNIILKLNDNNIENLLDIIKSILLFEAKWLQYKAEYYNGVGNSYRDRADTIVNRID